jgi:hypothetical protein
MTDINQITKSLYAKEKIYTPTFISKLNDTEKKNLRDNTDSENSFLMLVIYLLLITFVIVMLILISQGDKYNPYPDERKFEGDKKMKEPGFFDKIYFFITGRHRVPTHASSCTHLSCKKANTHSLNNVSNTVNDNYNYLSGNQTTKNNFGNNSSTSEYESQFDNSRRCLINNEQGNNNKHSYLSYNIDPVDLD